MNKKIFNFQFSIFNSSSKGFTLVELIIAVALFTLVAFISIGAILTIFDANKRAQSSKTVVDNLNFAIEDMIRTVRFGDEYYCDSDPNGIPFASQPPPVNCSLGGSRIAVNFNDNTIVYRWRGGINDPIEKSDDGGSNYTAITAPETKIEYLNFFVFGAGISEQPYMIVVIKGYSGNKSTTQSKFSIETLMSQRNLDS